MDDLKEISTLNKIIGAKLNIKKAEIIQIRYYFHNDLSV